LYCYYAKGKLKMGNIYYATCLECKEAIRLGKYFDWKPVVTSDNMTVQSVIEETIESINEENQTNAWIKLALRLHYFLSIHNGHKIWIGHENDDFIEQSYWCEKSFYELYKFLKF